MRSQRDLRRISDPSWRCPVAGGQLLPDERTVVMTGREKSQARGLVASLMKNRTSTVVHRVRRVCAK